VTTVRLTDVDQAVIDLRDGVEHDPAPASAPAPAPAAGGTRLLADDEWHRTVRVIALALLILLNLLDIVTTSAFLRAGVSEGNPVAALGIESGWIGFVKAGLLLGLGIRVLDGKPRLASTCGLWFVTGVYATVVCVNVLALRAAGGSLL
jgi:hypothetical protein